MSFNTLWLTDPSAIRAIFIVAEIKKYTLGSWVSHTIYLSTTGYITQDSATIFQPIINNKIKFSESISIDSGGSSISFGDLEIVNFNGERDSWLDSSQYIWANGTLTAYLGDPRWVSANLAALKDSCKVIFKGVIADIDSKSREVLNIKFRDTLQRLNNPITELKMSSLGGANSTWANDSQNKEALVPLVFGEVFNIEPLLIDPVNLKYILSGVNVEAVIELRDNGVPLYTSNGLGVVEPYPDDLPTITNTTDGGIVTLAHPLAGTLTASVQGIKAGVDLVSSSSSSVVYTNQYTNKIAELIVYIVTMFGNAETKLTAADIDWDSFRTFNTANPQGVGIFVSSKENVLTVCEQLASSVGAQLFVNKEGKLQLARVGSYTSNPNVSEVIPSINDTDIILHSLSVSNRPEIVSSAVKIAYCKNWTVQEDLLTSIPEAHKTIFATEWYTIIDSNPSIEVDYKLSAEPEQKETLLLTLTDATAEATRLRQQVAAARSVYKFTGTSRLLNLVLGQQVTLIHNRFGLESPGKIGQVVSLSPDWLNSKIEVEVLI